MELLNWNYLQRKIMKDLGVTSKDVDEVIMIAEALRPYKNREMNLETRNLCTRVAKSTLSRKKSIDNCNLM